MPATVSILLTVALPLLILLLLVERGTAVVFPIAEVLLASGAVLLVARNPGPGLLILLVFVPLQLVALSYVFKLGMPANVVRGLGSVKDVVVIGLVVNAFVTRRRRRLDVADRFALLLIFLILLYLFAPSLTPGLLGSTPFHPRLLAAREDGLFVLAFLAARRADIRAIWLERAKWAVLFVGFVMSVCAIINVAFSSTWNRFLQVTIHLPWYKALITGQPLASATNLFETQVGTHETVRASSLMSDALVLGFYLLPAFAIGLYYLAKRQLVARYIVLSVLCAVAIIATATRSAILAAAFAAVGVAWVSARRRAPGWLRLLFLLVAAVIVVAPIASSTSAGQRTSEAESGQDVSAQGHVTASAAAFDDLISHPLGRGLGTAPSIGGRFNVKGTLYTENAYLQVGNEIGAVSMFAFVGLLLATIVALAHRSRRDDPHGLATAMCGAAVGLAVGGFFLQIWQDYATALTFWALAGLALGYQRSEA